MLLKREMKVRVKQYSRCPPGWASEMMIWCGKEVIIKEVYVNDDDITQVFIHDDALFEDGGWEWSEDNFEPIETDWDK